MEEVIFRLLDGRDFIVDDECYCDLCRSDLPDYIIDSHKLLFCTRCKQKLSKQMEAIKETEVVEV